MILVTGATGIVGGPLVRLLAQDGVTAVTRDPAAATLPPGVRAVRPDEVAAALRGVSAVFVNPRAVGAGVGELLALARAKGVRRAVVLSAINVADDPERQPSRYRGDRNKEAEDAVVGSGLDWVSLRPTVFAANLLGMWGAQIRAGDVVRGPYAAATSAPIHERDIASVAARALVADDLLGRKLVLTGPRSLTQAELVTAIGAALDRPLRFAEVPPDAARNGMIEHGLPERFAAAFLALQASTVGHPAVVTDDVATVLGRAALPIEQWAREHAAELSGLSGPSELSGLDVAR